MKPQPHRLAIIVIAVSLLVSTFLPASAAERVGTYDSRVVAYAEFLSEPHQAQLAGLKQAALAAKADPDHSRYESLVKQVTARQHDLHMQVFSTAPIDAVIADLKDRLPAVLQDAQVGRLVSRWDEPALAGVPVADRVDVTDRLVETYHLPPAKLAQLDQIRQAKPVPLWRARALSWLHLF